MPLCSHPWLCHPEGAFCATEGSLATLQRKFQECHPEGVYFATEGSLDTIPGNCSRLEILYVNRRKETRSCLDQEEERRGALPAE